MTAAASSAVCHADAVVVGAGPAGSAVAYLLADAGHDVVLVEKETFPRDKVCGDGLTPRAVKALGMLGLHDEAEGRVPGWERQEGLRMYGGGVVLDLPWPELDDWPGYSLTATRALLDHTLARNAARAGAQLWEATEVTGPVWLSSAQRRVAGVTYRRNGQEGVLRAPLVLAADGGSSRFAVQLGLRRIPSRPMGVAVRAYYRGVRELRMMEGFLELYRGNELLPGYGWIFPLDDGLVNVGWGLLNTSSHFRSVNYRRILDQWVAGFPPAWGIARDTMLGKPRSAGLPMGHNRKPPLYRGALLVGDAAGMVNPFNGEGIGYAIEAAAHAAEAADAALRARSDAPLEAYEAALAREWGGYFTLGRIFVDLIGHPTVMRLCTEHGMPRRRVMEFVFRVMAHLTNRRSADLADRVIKALSRAVPAA
ncbi:MAG TPA: geranylgeranyl reductase family protein [Egibacteraceae bacterium]|nr:geranylgeranyl reductase family protein [Actinomycetota bacterium]HWB72331.1 geranylgeranyl reductase family protein [Egibacteraceae bacterium]